MTAATTYPTIRNGWVSVLEDLTPGFRADKGYRLVAAIPPEMSFEEWCEENPQTCFRRFHVRRSGERELPFVSSADVEQLRSNAELVVAYPKAFANFNRSASRREMIDIEDVIDTDAEQINRAIGIGGAANYVSGQSLCTAEYRTEEERLVLFLVFDLETIYYDSA